jgi:hypothetical protein
VVDAKAGTTEFIPLSTIYADYKFFTKEMAERGAPREALIASHYDTVRKCQQILDTPDVNPVTRSYAMAEKRQSLMEIARLTGANQDALQVNARIITDERLKAEQEVKLAAKRLVWEIMQRTNPELCQRYMAIMDEFLAMEDDIIAKITSSAKAPADQLQILQKALKEPQTIEGIAAPVP